MHFCPTAKCGARVDAKPAKLYLLLLLPLTQETPIPSVRTIASREQVMRPISLQHMQFLSFRNWTTCHVAEKQRHNCGREKMVERERSPFSLRDSLESIVYA